jgi:6-phosphofructokinase 1
MIVVAEGAHASGLGELARANRSGENKLGGIGELVAAEIASLTGKDTRCCVLGHLQRGGAPTVLDRILGTGFGVKAVELVAAGKFGSMVSYQNYLLTDVPIADAVNRLRLVPRNAEMVQTARAMGISFGD